VIPASEKPSRKWEHNYDKACFPLVWCIFFTYIIYKDKMKYEALGVFDMLKTGIGPSSSHTLGPWRAVQRFMEELKSLPSAPKIKRIQITLYGSLALTGNGHCTDKAVSLALLGYDPVTIDVSLINNYLGVLSKEKVIKGENGIKISFDPAKDIIFDKDFADLKHPNTMKCKAFIENDEYVSVFYSVGGGFVIKEGEKGSSGTRPVLPFPCQQTKHLLEHCTKNNMKISEMVWQNEQAWLPGDDIKEKLLNIWQEMKQCIFRGCSTTGILPGKLKVKRQAGTINREFFGEKVFNNADLWIKEIKNTKYSFSEIMRWISCFAEAVNEENADMGRVVTAPTNGSAGVIPAVLLYYICFSGRDIKDDDIIRYLLVAGEIGTFFKKNATISAAMGGCQAEIGVASSMAAAALCELNGGSVRHCLMAAEIAMEHHLGMTCDPVGGLVQIPCIERNAMGAVKAINAAELALSKNPLEAKVSLDNVIKTMWKTAKDMNSNYKETSRGGLAVTVDIPEC
jgi:L-serine dehydratase